MLPTTNIQTTTVSKYCLVFWLCYITIMTIIIMVIIIIIIIIIIIVKKIR